MDSWRTTTSIGTSDALGDLNSTGRPSLTDERFNRKAQTRNVQELRFFALSQARLKSESHGFRAHSAERRLPWLRRVTSHAVPFGIYSVVGHGCLLLGRLNPDWRPGRFEEATMARGSKTTTRGRRRQDRAIHDGEESQAEPEHARRRASPEARLRRHEEEVGGPDSDVFRAMNVTVAWVPAEAADHGSGVFRCLYAYLIPPDHEIVYVGRSWGVSVRGRWSRSAKPEFWDALERQRGVRRHRIVIGIPLLPEGRRLTFELLSDVESLLIWHEQPWGNIQCRRSRISRPGLRVRCEGDWPGRPQYFDR